MYFCVKFTFWMMTFFFFSFFLQTQWIWSWAQWTLWGLDLMDRTLDRTTLFLVTNSLLFTVGVNKKVYSCACMTYRLQATAPREASWPTRPRMWRERRQKAATASRTHTFSGRRHRLWVGHTARQQTQRGGPSSQHEHFKRRTFTKGS